MYETLKARAASSRPIRIGLVGAGAMGLGIAWQVGHTPGMELSFVADRDLAAARKAQSLSGHPARVAEDALELLKDESLPCDVLVEATNCIGLAADYCLAAIARRAHVVLMNAEVDLWLGHLLQAEAARAGVVVTSDAGDQHGVLMRMLDEIRLWAFDLVQAGNIKGFLNRHATAQGLLGEAKKRNLNPVQCCAYSDGSKLNIEMALVANATGMIPLKPGMEGPRCERVEEVLNLFDFDAYKGIGRVDYILGAQPGGGVYIVAKCDDDFQKHYLWYYKLHGRHPYYLFYRPYHLCHLETTRAIALAALWNKAVLTPRSGRVADVYAYAKQDLKPGATIGHGIGSDEVYGMIAHAPQADAAGQLPQGLLEAEGNEQKPRLKRAVKKDMPLTYGDVELPDSRICRLFAKQQQLLAKDKKRPGRN